MEKEEEIEELRVLNFEFCKSFGLASSTRSVPGGNILNLPSVFCPLPLSQLKASNLDLLQRMVSDRETPT